MRKPLVLVFLLLIGLQSMADVKLPKIFSSSMVLQRQKPIPVWGWADAGEKVVVQLSSSGKVTQTKNTKAGKDGKWIIRLDALEAGGPYELSVKGKKNTLNYTDVLIGEVWVCSGQSNMEWPVQLTDNAEEEIKNANYPNIRHFTVPKDMSFSPKNDLIGGEWQVTTPENVPRFTAVGYYFARELYGKLGVPIGLINTSWGGTHVETWISKEGMASFDEFAEPVASLPTSIDEYNAKRKQYLDNLITEKHGGFPAASEVSTWSTAGLDDSNWPVMDQPKAFDREVLPDFDGTIWFRKQVTLPQQVAGKTILLSVGQIHDTDEVYLNGTKVGSGTQKGKNRQYIVPGNVVKEGTNVIAIKVTNTGDGAGIRGKVEQLFIAQGDFELSLAGPWKYRIESSTNTNRYLGPNNAGTLLYNSMIAPLVPYAIQGAIWYQGESNAGRAYQYRKSFPLMISDWRKKWGDEFPFYFVQLASFDAGKGNSERGSSWAELREAQTMTLSALPKTGMAVTNDIGHPTDIHPRNKQDVGKRLALNALKQTYGQNVVYSGPMYQSMQTSGNKVTLSFLHTDGGLHCVEKYGYLTGFEVAGDDQKFYLARGEIQGEKVVIWSDKVTKPVAVRYGWSDDNADANLFNGSSLPAVPFRTDNWKGITENGRFR